MNKSYDMAWGNAVAVRSAFLEGLPYTFVPFTLTNENLAYTAHDGDAQLIEITRKVIERQVGTTYRHVFLTNGATGGCTIALRAMGWAGYKTVITRQPPYFPIYPAIIKAANMDHVYENPEFCTDNSVILFDSPSNPYGEIEHAIYLPNRPIVHDAVYHSRVYALNLKPLPCSIVVGSYSKLTGLNGLRTGWVATNDGGLAMHLKSLVEAEYCGLSSASTLVLLTALKEYRTKTAWEGFERRARNKLDSNREEFSKLEKYFGDQPVGGIGMFYYAPIDGACKRLLKRSGIIWTPGTSLGTNDDYGRFNLGQDCTLVKQAVREVIKNDKS